MQKTYSQTRMRHRRSKKTPRWGKTAVRLVVAMSVFVGVFLLKLLFPSAMEGLRQGALPLLDKTIDYKAAFSAMGAGIAGGGGMDSFLEGLSILAFGTQPEGDIQVNAQTKNLPDSLAITSFVEGAWAFAGQQKQAEGQVEEPAEEEPAEATPDPDAAMVAAFQESQAAFIGYTIPADATAEKPDLGLDYTQPVSGTVTSYFGYREHPIDEVIKFHYGLDIGADLGTDILAFAEGTVLATGDSASLGLYVIIEHAGGIQTQYAHCSQVYVQSGDTVTKGQVIAAVGDTGISTGPHLHFSISKDGISLNPGYYLGVYG